jgi:hypothetical protein
MSSYKLSIVCKQRSIFYVLHEALICHPSVGRTDYLIDLDN